MTKRPRRGWSTRDSGPTPAFRAAQAMQPFGRPLRTYCMRQGLQRIPVPEGWAVGPALRREPPPAEPADRRAPREPLALEDRPAIALAPFVPRGRRPALEASDTRDDRRDLLPIGRVVRRRLEDAARLEHAPHLADEEVLVVPVGGAAVLWPGIGEDEPPPRRAPP